LGYQVSFRVDHKVSIQDFARTDSRARARDLLRQICQAREAVIIRGAVAPDYIHLLLSAPPEMAPSQAGALSEGRIVTKAAGRNSGLAKARLGTALVCAEATALDEDTIKKYTENQNGTKGIKDSRSPRPLSLDPVLSRKPLTGRLRRSVLEPRERLARVESAAQFSGIRRGRGGRKRRCHRSSDCRLPRRRFSVPPISSKKNYEIHVRTWVLESSRALLQTEGWCCPGRK
jgi:putative transposase